MRILFLVLSLFFCLSSGAATRKGDVNGDNQVTLVDVMFMVDYLLGVPNSAFVKANADMTGDKEINLADLMAIVDLVLSPEEEMGPGSADDPDVDGN